MLLLLKKEKSAAILEIMRLATTIIFGILWNCVLRGQICLANPDSKRLYDDLLSNYNRLIRPVVNHTETVTVKLGLRLSQLVDLVSNFHTLFFYKHSILWNYSVTRGSRLNI